MRVLRWLLWLALLALLTLGVYVWLERRGREKTPAAAPPAVDQTTERDREQLDRLIESLQKKKP